MAAAQIFPAPNSGAAGTASLTVKLASGATSGKVTLSGVSATAVTINEAFAGATGASLITLAANGGTAGEWDVPAGALLSADQVTALLQGKLYVIATSAANPAGAIRGQINASSTPPPAAPTLTQLKSSAFSVCGGCHTGGGTSLPASMDLTPSHIYASIVNVASVEQPALQRVKPGDPDNSYVVQKLEGAATIAGNRMPLGGPFLDQATIDQVRAWITAGAVNN